MAFVSGQNEQNPTARSQFLEAQRTQTVTRPSQPSFKDTAGNVYSPFDVGGNSIKPISSLTPEEVQQFNQAVLQRQLESGVASIKSGTTMNPAEIAKQNLIEKYVPLQNTGGIGINQFGQPVSTPTSPYSGTFVTSTRPNEFIQQKTFKDVYPDYRTPNIKTTPQDLTYSQRQQDNLLMGAGGTASPIAPPTVAQIEDLGNRIILAGNPIYKIGVPFLNKYGITPQYLGDIFGQANVNLFRTTFPIISTYETALGGGGTSALKTYTSGYAEGIINDLETRPIKTAELLGEGYLFGSAIRAFDLAFEPAGYNLAMIGKRIIEGGLLGTTIYATGTGVAESISSGGLKGLGEYSGVVSKDLLLFGTGMKFIKNLRGTGQMDLKGKEIMKEEDNDLTLFIRDLFERGKDLTSEFITEGKGLYRTDILEEPKPVDIQKTLDENFKLLFEPKPPTTIGGEKPIVKGGGGGGSGGRDGGGGTVINIPVDEVPPNIPTNPIEPIDIVIPKQPIETISEIQKISLQNFYEDKLLPQEEALEAQRITRRRPNEIRRNVKLNEYGIPIDFIGKKPVEPIDIKILESRSNLDRALNEFRGGEGKIDLVKQTRDFVKNQLSKKPIFIQFYDKEPLSIESPNKLIQRGNFPEEVKIEKNPYREFKEPVPNPMSDEDFISKIREKEQQLNLKKAEQRTQEDRLRNIILSKLDTGTKTFQELPATFKEQREFIFGEETPIEKAKRTEVQTKLVRDILEPSRNQIIEKPIQEKVLSSLDSAQKKLSDSLFENPTEYKSAYYGKGTYERSSFGERLIGYKPRYDNTKVNMGNVGKIDLGGVGSNLEEGLSSSLGGSNKYSMGLGLGLGLGLSSAQDKAITSVISSGQSSG